MTQKTIILCGIFSLFFLTLPAQHKLRIVDNESGEAIPFAVISGVDKNKKVIAEADIDGWITINDVAPSQLYHVNRLGYKELSMNGSELNSMSILKMEMLAVEMNPIVVSPDAAWKNLNLAIENTYKLIPTEHFYIACYQNDSARRNNSVVVSAYASYVSEITRLNKASKGCKFKTKLKELYIDNKQNINIDSIHWFTTNYEVPYINRFLVGSSRQNDKELIFYMLDSNDSISIIGYTPKKNYIPGKKRAQSSGRFIINKDDWTILRIDSEIAPVYMSRIAETQSIDEKAHVVLVDVRRSIFFEKGLPLKIEEIRKYRTKQDKSKALWENSTTHSYNHITKKDFIAVPDKNRKRAPIITQKPYNSNRIK